MPPVPSRLAAPLVLAATLALPAAAAALNPPRPADGSVAERLRIRAATSYVDVRGADRSAGPASVPATTRAAQRSLRREAGADAAVALDESTGTVRSLQRFDGRLSGALTGSPASAARGWARRNAALLGLGVADVDGLDAPETARTPGGLTIVTFGQRAAGIPAYDNDLRVVLDDADRVVRVTGSPIRGLGTPDATPALTAREAIGRVATGVGGPTPAAAAPAQGSRRTTRFDGGDRARLVWFRTQGDTRLAWSLTYAAPGPDVFHAVVDADSGRLLRRVNQTKYADANVFRNFPGADAGGTPEAVDAYVTSGAIVLSGPYARTFADVNDDDQPNAGEEVTPGPYAFKAFSPSVGQPCAAGSGLCGWDPLVRRSWADNRAQTAVQSHWLVSNFATYLRDDPDIAFTEGNFEGDDRVVVDVDDGADKANGLPDAAHVDNANMATPPDGSSPRMQLYLANGPQTRSVFRSVNLGDDAATVYHEYTHGLSNRLVTDADGNGALGSPQSGAMGEAWSDWYAEDYLVRKGLETDSPTPGEIDLGTYSDVKRHSTRTSALDCPVGAQAQCPGTATAGSGGYTYGDFGKIVRGPEVHADGEIWAQTLWDLRAAVTPDVARLLITEGMRVSVPEPSYLDMRDAILASAPTDAVRATVWSVFAARGMGYFAGALDGADTRPVEDFSTPPPAGAGSGTIAGTVTDRDTGAPVAGQRVAVAGVPAAADLTATTGADGRYSIAGVPAGTIGKVVFPPSTGHDPAIATGVVVVKDTTTTLDERLRYDWASAVVATAATNDDSSAPFGCGVAGVHDQSLGSGWSAFDDAVSKQDGNPHPGAPPTVTIDLQRAIDVTELGLDPAATCGDGPSATTKDYRVETSPDGASWTTAKTGSFAPADAGRLNLVAPDAGASGVRYVRLTMLSAQDESEGASGADFRDFSELAVYGSPAQPPAAATATPGPGPAQTATPAPSPTPSPAPAPVRPRIGVGKPVRGGARFTPTCPTGCRVRATVAVSKRVAKRIGRGKRRTLARLSRTVKASAKGRATTLRLSRQLRRAIVRRGVRRLRVTLTVRATSTVGGRSATRTVRRTVRLRL